MKIDYFSDEEIDEYDEYEQLIDIKSNTFNVI